MLQDENDISAGETCWLCGRPLGRQLEYHHPKPKSRGGRVTVAVHPICHQAIHANFTNTELARLEPAATALADNPAMAKFLSWIVGKPADFHAPTGKPNRPGSSRPR